LFGLEPASSLKSIDTSVIPFPGIMLYTNSENFSEVLLKALLLTSALAAEEIYKVRISIKIFFITCFFAVKNYNIIEKIK